MPALLPAVLALVLALVPAPAARAAALEVSVERDGDGVTVSAETWIPADVGTAWRVLTDYERYVGFVPGLRQSRVVARHDGHVTVEQSGEVSWLLLRWPLDAVYEVDESPMSGLRSHGVAAHAVLDSVYALAPEGGGVRLRYRGTIMPRDELLGAMERAAGRRVVEREFAALVAEIERREVRAAPAW